MPKHSTAKHKKILIRKAGEKDAAGIVQIHYDAVHITAAKDYAKVVLDDWSNLTNDRIKRQGQYISSNPKNTIMLVAEIEGDIVGFGEIAPATRELCAVYVSPAKGRIGVGSALLEELETIAGKQGIYEVWLDSSLTAEPFYLAHGYVSDGRSEHSLQSGEKMVCVKMRKKISGKI